MHAMGLTLVTEQTSSGRELNADARLLVAAEWLQVRVDVLVVVALERCGLVCAARLTLLGAVVLAVLVGTLLVENVAASNLSALLFKLGLGRVCGRLNVFMAVQGLWCNGRGSAFFCVIPVFVRSYSIQIGSSTYLCSM